MGLEAINFKIPAGNQKAEFYTCKAAEPIPQPHRGHV
jgi:hypothetical protein